LTSGSPEEILRHFSKRQVDTVQGAAIILTLIVVGILGLIAGLTWAYLRGGLDGWRAGDRMSESLIWC
jgi:type IV secretory pathway TrbL component